MNSSKNKNVVRPIGNYERAWQVVHDTYDGYCNVGFTIRYKIPINLSFYPSTSSSIPDETKNIILRILYPTLEKTILKEPSLAVSFADLDTSKPLYIRLSELDLSRIVRFVIVNNEDDVAKMLEDEHARKFDVQDISIPLWRIIVGIKGTSIVKDGWNLTISFLIIMLF